MLCATARFTCFYLYKDSSDWTHLPYPPKTPSQPDWTSTWLSLPSYSHYTLPSNAPPYTLNCSGMTTYLSFARTFMKACDSIIAPTLLNLCWKQSSAPGIFQRNQKGKEGLWEGVPCKCRYPGTLDCQTPLYRPLTWPLSLFLKQIVSNRDKQCPILPFFPEQWSESSLHSQYPILIQGYLSTVPTWNIHSSC